MTFSSIIHNLFQKPITKSLLDKLEQEGELYLNGIPRLPKSLVASSLARGRGHILCVICPTLQEAGRWAAQLEAMGWGAVHFYPTSEASPYDSLPTESETVWGQMQVLSSLSGQDNMAIVATERSCQPHLPPPSVFQSFCLNLQSGMTFTNETLQNQLTQLGYERVPLVETEGQWGRREDIVDIFPVSAELPVRLEWLGEELEQLREFDPATQRSLDKIEQLLLTPTSFQAIKKDERLTSLLDYLPQNTVCAFDEVAQCAAHNQRWLEGVEEQWQCSNEGRKMHRPFTTQDALDKFKVIYLTEYKLVQEKNGVNLASRPLPTTPHQFAKLAAILGGKQEISTNLTLKKYETWLISAQPSRCAALLQEHDCPAQFLPNPHNYAAIRRLHQDSTPVALKYAGLAELEGFILPTYNIAVVTDREFFGQHSLVTTSYVRKRRRAASKTVDLQKLSPGDYVVHKRHGVGKFLQLETLGTREYIAVSYADGLLRVPADSLEVLSRYRTTDGKPPELDKMSGKAWQSKKNRVRKTVKKLAFDLLQLYAQRSQLSGYAYPPDIPWQKELEDSFPYELTTDQLKAIQDVKRDLESDRPMDRLVCGDVGFGKTEVALRAIFKVVSSADKQVAFLAPTTILSQQHYHTLKERFAPYPINIGLLNRFRSPKERKDIIQRLATGELDIVVGTQQLLNKEVKYRDLGLLVIDEEQRFGVNQKEKIKNLKAKLDILTLTATPIPRTLYMSLSGIREMSIIATPPPSRRPIQTHLSPYSPDVVRTGIRNELDRGGQVFYVVRRVEGIEKVAIQLEEMVPGVKVAMAHGQMSPGELEATMLAFNNGEADILVCTTIIESGLDIPRVNTIIIEDAQYFGLAQLYQLRGRVGRSGIQARAWLLYPDNQILSETARKRLRALQEFSQLGSGYQLATRDMEIRGVGNILGAEQSGQMEAIGFELYMEMLQSCIAEIQGEEIPQVEDTQVDLQLTAFIPGNYIASQEQKMAAYRAVAAANSQRELKLIAAEWSDRYGSIPAPVEQLFSVMQLKQIAKSLGFSRIKPEGKQHIVLITPMAEPAWKLLAEKLPQHLRSRFVYERKKVTVRGLGVLKPQQQLDNLIEWLGAIEDVSRRGAETQREG